MRVEDWFPQFMVEHQARLPRTDWPELGTEDGDVYWTTFETNLRRSGADRDLATEASIILAGDPPKYLGDQSKAILAVVSKLREQQSNHGQVGDFSTRAEAYKASIGCHDCSATGLATRFRHAPLKIGQGPTVQLLCVCPMGRWTKSRYEGDKGPCPWSDLKDFPELWRRQVSYQDQPDNPHCHHPDSWNAVDCRPIDATLATGKYRQDSARRLAQARSIERPAAPSETGSLPKCFETPQGSLPGPHSTRPDAQDVPPPRSSGGSRRPSPESPC